MFESFEFNKAIVPHRKNMLYAREEKLLHELNSREDYTNLAFEYNSPYKATNARMNLIKYAKAYNMPFAFMTRKSTLYVVKEEDNV